MRLLVVFDLSLFRTTVYVMAKSKSDIERFCRMVIDGGNPLFVSIFDCQCDQAIESYADIKVKKWPMAIGHRRPVT